MKQRIIIALWLSLSFVLPVSAQADAEADAIAFVENAVVQLAKQNWTSEAMKAFSSTQTHQASNHQAWNQNVSSILKVTGKFIRLDKCRNRAITAKTRGEEVRLVGTIICKTVYEKDDPVLIAVSIRQIDGNPWEIFNVHFVSYLIL